MVWAGAIIAASCIFAFSWLLRYNDPDGAFVGLSDDHFYYVIRGWQMLFGERPDRDYVDAGAPLAYLISAALQVLVARGTWSEFVFCITALSLGAALTCLVAARASGSILLGVLAAMFEVAAFPRLYNYPKILVYAVAIPVLWWWIGKPGTRRTWLIALVAAVAFLLRHDHGLYVAGAFAFAVLAVPALGLKTRVRQAAIFAFALLVLLAPYLTYLQTNGGIQRHFEIGYRWSQRDRDRAPLVVPELHWQPLSTGEPSDAPASEWWHHAPFPALNGYRTWWLFWLVEVLPGVAVLLLLLRPEDRLGGWADDRVKIATVAVFALLVNTGFLRGNLPTQIPDVAVPAAVLGAWVLSTTWRIVRRGRVELRGRSLNPGLLARSAAAIAMFAVVMVTGVLLLPSLREQIENSSLLDGPEAIRADAEGVTERLTRIWPLENWARDDTRGPVQLALYFDACTAPSDKVLVTPYLPPAVGLARRAFAGGQGDLRAGFFDLDAEQQLTVERLQRQSVPVIIGPRDEEREEFARRLPRVAAYLAREYEDLGERQLGEGLVVSLLINRRARAVRTYEPLAFPCFR